MNRKIRILVAEDEFLVSEEIVRAIKRAGYEHIGTAPDGEKAIEMVKALKPDLLMMDIKMPKMDGLEAARKIQETNPLPVVILTAHEGHELVQEAGEAGVGAYITKPPAPEEIDRAVTIAFARQTDLIKSRELIKQLEESNTKLEENEKKLNELVDSKNKMFSIIAHDLRNPVGTLMGYASLLADEFDSLENEDKKELAIYAKNISLNVNKLLESLLDWSRFESGHLEFDHKQVNVSQLTGRIISLLGPSAELKNIAIINNIKLSVNVMADEFMLETAVRNIVSNAIKFTMPGGKVEISARKRGESLIICVSDDGIGMEKEQLDNVFSIHSSKSTPGTQNETGAGLGLILCKEMIEKKPGKN